MPGLTRSVGVCTTCGQPIRHSHAIRKTCPVKAASKARLMREDIVDALRSKDFTKIAMTESFTSFGRTYHPEIGKVRLGELYGEYSNAFQALRASGKVKVNASGFIELNESEPTP